MMPIARVVHQVGDRTRLSIAARRGDQAYFDAVAEQLVGVEAIHRVTTNPLTGSVLVECSGSLREALRKARAEALFDLVPVGASATAGTSATKAEPPPTSGMGGMASPMLLTSALFGVVGMVQTARGELMMPALAAFWYAFNAYQMAVGGGASVDRRGAGRRA